MAKKLAPLVIPAVIDTSGIDRGVNSIRNKLSRVQGGNVGGVGGGGAFSGGVVPYGGSGAAAAAMAAAFGASVAQRNSGSNFIRWDTAGKFNQFPAGRGRMWGATNNPAAFNRAFPQLANTNIMTNFTANASRQLNLAEYKSMRADVRTAGRETLSRRNLSINSIANTRDALEIAQQRRREMIRQRRIEPFRRFTSGIEERGSAMFAGLRQSAGVMAGLGFGVTQTYQAFTKKGIQNTFSDISGLNPRDYQTAATIKRRAMTGYGTPGIMQSFFIGAERSGGMQGVRGGGSMAEKAMSTVAKVIGAQFEQATTAVFSPIQFIQNQFDPRKSYFTSQKRALQ